MPSYSVAKVDMGTGLGFHWYGALDYPLQRMLREKCGLTGGDAPYPVAVAVFSAKRSDWFECSYVGRHLVGLTESGLRAKLRQISAKPDMVAEYAVAYFELRGLEGRPVSSEILDAYGILAACYSWQPNGFARPVSEAAAEAGNRLLHAADSEAVAVAVVGVTLPEELHRHPGAPVVVSSLGQTLLKQIPRDTVAPVLHHLADTLQDRKQAASCRELLDQL